jgi:hypothetical protein
MTKHTKSKSVKSAKPSHSDGELELEDERRRKKEQRRAKRHLAKHLAELGLDEHGEPTDNFSLLKYPVREWKFKLPGLHEPIALNPVVTFISVVCLWGIVLWSSGKFVNMLATGARYQTSELILGPFFPLIVNSQSHHGNEFTSRVARKLNNQIHLVRSRKQGRYLRILVVHLVQIRSYKTGRQERQTGIFYIVLLLHDLRCWGRVDRSVLLRARTPVSSTQSLLCSSWLSLAR